MTNPLVRATHPGVEGVALVPEKALRHMSPKWRVIDDAPAADTQEPPSTSPSTASKPGKRARTSTKEK